MPILRQPVDREKAALARQLRRTMTTPERLLWEQLRANRLAGVHFRRQQVIAGFIVDFYCHAARLVIEVDGPVHDNQQQEDLERERMLGDQGLKIIRFSNHEIESNMPEVLQRILCAVAGRG
jgi:very-short-patch-repair endonuclease